VGLALGFYREVPFHPGMAVTLNVSRTIVPIYQSEISPPNHVRIFCFFLSKDDLGSMNIFPAGCLGVYGIHCKCPRLRHFRGQHDFLVLDSSTLIIKQWMDYFCSFIDSDLSWRLPLFIQCVIGAILAGGSLILPESPRCVSWFSHHNPINALQLAH
jgi:hypothetical protein